MMEKGFKYLKVEKNKFNPNLIGYDRDMLELEKVHQLKRIADVLENGININR